MVKYAGIQLLCMQQVLLSNPCIILLYYEAIGVLGCGICAATWVEFLLIKELVIDGGVLLIDVK